jgi:type IX secretion system PorP/SprF family membrane protein
MIKHLFTLLVFIQISTCVMAQDAQLSQFYASPIYTNPAFAGAEKKIRIVSTSRNQYTTLNHNYKTTAFSVDGYLPKYNGGLALIASYDLAGDGFLQTINLAGIYSYHIPVNRKWNINAALQGGIIQRTYDLNKLKFEDQFSEFVGFSNLPSKDVNNLGFQGIVFPNFSFGMLAYNKTFYGGFSVHNLFEPNQTFISSSSGNNKVPLSRRYSANMGINIFLNKTRFAENNNLISPNILIMNQLNFYQINLGLYLKNKAFTIGTWLRQTSRNSDAMIFLLGVKLPNFRIGYSYDLPLTKVVIGGSHELSLIFLINQNTKSRSRKSTLLICPDL